MTNKNLREAGLKVTLPRANILQILENVTSRHLSAEDIYQILLEQGCDVGLATVYRVLTQFEAAGLVKRHHFSSSQALFELAQGKHHDHLVCMKCNAISEFVDEIIEQRQVEIARRKHFKMTDHSLIIYGFCKACT
jgi:Fur family transcriptional regulator, ferric uptake regulator